MARAGDLTHYDRLGVASTASMAEIRRAYRALAKVAHPDAGGDSNEFRHLTEAYEVLTNPLLRKEYDDRLQVERFVRGEQVDLSGDRWSRSWRAQEAEDDGWAGAEGSFTGDVEFPDYLQDITEAPWSQSSDDSKDHRPPERDAGARDPSTLRHADVLWRSVERSIVEPHLAGEVVVIATPDEVIAMDAFHGRELWHAEVVAPAAGPACVCGDTVAVWTSDGLLHGLDIGRGVTRWEQPIGQPGPGQLAAVEGLVVVAAADARVLTFDPITGRPRWNAALGAAPTVPLARTGSVVVAGTERSVDAFDARKGKVRWRAPVPAGVSFPLCPAAGSVWVGVGSGKVSRLDIRNGSRAGVWDVGSPVAGMVADGVVLYATVVGPDQLVAVDGTGFVRWATGLDVASPEPALIAGTAYVASPSGAVTAIDTIDGSVIGGATLPFEPFGAPIGFVDRLLVPARDGHLWCIDLSRMIGDG